MSCNSQHTKLIFKTFEAYLVLSVLFSLLCEITLCVYFLDVLLVCFLGVFLVYFLGVLLVYFLGVLLLYFLGVLLVYFLGVLLVCFLGVLLVLILENYLVILCECTFWVYFVSVLFGCTLWVYFLGVLLIKVLLTTAITHPWRLTCLIHVCTLRKGKWNADLTGIHIYYDIFQSKSDIVLQKVVSFSQSWFRDFQL